MRVTNDQHMRVDLIEQAFQSGIGAALVQILVDFSRAVMRFVVICTLSPATQW